MGGRIITTVKAAATKSDKRNKHFTDDLPIEQNQPYLNVTVRNRPLQRPIAEAAQKSDLPSADLW